MFTTEEATAERVDAYVVALEREKAGYLARQKQLAEGKQGSLDHEQLQARVEAVDAELARVKGGSVKKSGKKDK